MLAKCTEWEAHLVSRNENIGAHWVTNFSRRYQWSEVEAATIPDELRTIMEAEAVKIHEEENQHLRV